MIYFKIYIDKQHVINLFNVCIITFNAVYNFNFKTSLVSMHGDILHHHQIFGLLTCSSKMKLNRKN